jgi:opacity protein-like surface antigen
LRAGALVAFGGRDSSIAYKPSGKAPAAAFNGEQSFDTIGWVAGGGIEWGLNGPWSIGFEYMRARLGKGSSASAGCAGTAAACEGFSGIAFENLHNALTYNVFRIAANYYFDFW